VPALGEILVSDEGISIMIVTKPKLEGSNYVAKGLVIHIPEDTNVVVDIPGIDEEFPIGYPVVAGGATWVKTGPNKFILKAYNPHFDA